MLFGDHDLVEDELQVGSDEMDAAAGVVDGGLGRNGRRGRPGDDAGHRGGRRRVHILQHPVGVQVDGMHAQVRARSRGMPTAAAGTVRVGPCAAVGAPPSPFGTKMSSKYAEPGIRSNCHV